jgi:hypothetical protein
MDEAHITTGNGDIPSSWIVEFSDFIVGNRFSIEYTNLSVKGQRCRQNGLVSCHHDRRFMWSGNQFVASEAWGNTTVSALLRILALGFHSTVEGLPLHAKLQLRDSFLPSYSPDLLLIVVAFQCG